MTISRHPIGEVMFCVPELTPALTSPPGQPGEGFLFTFSFTFSFS